MTRKIRNQFISSYVDENGEVHQKESFQTYSLGAEDDYIKIYVKHISFLSNLPSGLDGLIYELIKSVNYGNRIVINSHIKREMAVNVGKTFNTVNQYITKLVDNKVLIREGRGVYYLNPLFYGKGKWKDIIALRERLQINLVYEEGKYSLTNSS
jgi:hypothetical protein